MALNMKTKLLYLFIFFLAGCAVVAPERVEIPSLVHVASRELPTLEDDLDQPSLELAVYRSMKYYNRLPETREFLFGDRVCTAGELKESLREFLKIIRMPGSSSDRIRRIKQAFDIYKSVGRRGGGEVLFTGYYEPILAGSFDATQEYCYPIYRTPDDHVVVDLGKFREKYRGERVVARIEDGRVVPYYTRWDIDVTGCLEGRGLNSSGFPIPLILFLQIQGSGVVKLPGGGLVQISYSQSNGHPYTSVGRLLVKQGKMSMEEVSLDGIKRYLRVHPEEMFDILNCNESYVFFRIVEEGPVGSLNVPVTSGRSIATDASMFPRGALAFIRVKKPVIDKDGNIVSWGPFSRFVLNQDAGGAIKGPGRVDLFCGRGRNAEIMAGHLKEEGDLYFLVKKK